MKNARLDATQGSLVRSIFAYAFPLLLTTLMQKLFSAVDIAILGNMADTTAVASVGATTMIIDLLVSSFIGFSSGTKIILARQVGAKDKDSLQKTISMSILFSLSVGLAIAVIGFFLAPTLLRVTHCPSACFESAKSYLRLYVLSSPAILLYNFVSSAIAATGDSKRPLYYMIASGLLNVVLNLALCFVLSDKVVAVALATVLSQLLGAFLVMRHILKTKDLCGFAMSNLHWNQKAFGDIIRYGGPLMLLALLEPFANLQMQTEVNLLDNNVAAVAGNSAGVTMETLLHGISTSFAATTTAFMGQNIGAGNKERAKKTFFYCLSFAFLFSTVLSGMMFLSKDFWLSMILTDDLASYQFAHVRMQVVVLAYFLSAVNNCVAHGTQALGYPVITMFTGAICSSGFRMLWIAFVYPYFAPSYFALVICTTLSWLLLLVSNTVVFFFLFRRYLKKDALQAVG